MFELDFDSFLENPSLALLNPFLEELSNFVDDDLLKDLSSSCCIEKSSKDPFTSL